SSLCGVWWDLLRCRDDSGVRPLPQGLPGSIYPSTLWDLCPSFSPPATFVPVPSRSSHGRQHSGCRSLGRAEACGSRGNDETDGAAPRTTTGHRVITALCGEPSLPNDRPHLAGEG